MSQQNQPPPSDHPPDPTTQGQPHAQGQQGHPQAQPPGQPPASPQQPQAPAPYQQQGQAPAQYQQPGQPAPAPYHPPQGQAPAPYPQQGQAPAPHPQQGQVPAPHPQQGQVPAPYPQQGQVPAPYPQQGQAQYPQQGAYAQPGGFAPQPQQAPVNVVVQQTVGGAAQTGQSGIVRVANRSKMVAALLAFFFGGLGFHKFYLGRTGMGLLYLLFCWTFIPAVVAFIEFIMLLVMSEQEFDLKFNSALAK